MIQRNSGLRSTVFTVEIDKCISKARMYFGQYKMHIEEFSTENMNCSTLLKEFLLESHAATIFLRCKIKHNSSCFMFLYSCSEYISLHLNRLL